MTQPTYPNQNDKNRNTDKKEGQYSSRDEESRKKEGAYSQDQEGKRKEQSQSQGHTPGFHKSQNPSSGHKEQSDRDSEKENQQNKGQDNTKYRP